MHPASVQDPFAAWSVGNELLAALKEEGATSNAVCGPLR